MIFTDYTEAKGVMLSYPEGQKDTDNASLAPFYLELINLIPDEIEISLICKSEDLFEKVKSTCQKANLKLILEPSMEEIWLRDMMGFKNDRTYILPRYEPTYFKEHYTKDRVFKIRADSVYFASKVMPDVDIRTNHINMDGGNLVTNGEIGFITEKIIDDNPRSEYSISIEKEIEDNLEIKPYFLKHFPEDILGHADGIIAFLDKYSIALSCYPEHLKSLKKERTYLNELKQELESQKFKVVSIYDRPVDEKIKAYGESMYSARGIFINFLRLNNTIILPQFNLPRSKSQIDYNSYNKEILKNEGFDVRTIQCDDLCILGGGLRCISWVY